MAISILFVYLTKRNHQNIHIHITAKFTLIFLFIVVNIITHCGPTQFLTVNLTYDFPLKHRVR